MNIIGIIAEYNPFHNGHIYHINKIKELYPESLIILVLNGYFLERGEISLLNKEAKAKIALKYGVDLVISLPFVFGCQSADNFAYGAIKILNLFKVNEIVFGSESADLNYLLNELKYIEKINPKKELKSGFSYPKVISNNINTPNDLLAISYLKAIKKINSNIKATPIKRTNDYYKATTDNHIISASNIRNRLNNNEDIKPYLPKELIKQFNFYDNEKLFDLIKYQLLTNDNLKEILLVDEGIENKLLKEIIKVNNINDFIENIKSKRYTYNKLNRMLITILLNVLKKDIDHIKTIDYIQILGMNTKGKKHLKQFKELNSLTKNYQSLIYKYEVRSAYLYQMLTNDQVLTFEKRNKPIIKD